MLNATSQTIHRTSRIFSVNHTINFNTPNTVRLSDIYNHSQYLALHILNSFSAKFGLKWELKMNGGGNWTYFCEIWVVKKDELYVSAPTHANAEVDKLNLLVYLSHIFLFICSLVGSPFNWQQQKHI